MAIQINNDWKWNLLFSGPRKKIVTHVRKECIPIHPARFRISQCDWPWHYTKKMRRNTFVFVNNHGGCDIAVCIAAKQNCQALFLAAACNIIYVFGSFPTNNFFRYRMQINCRFVEIENTSRVVHCIFNVCSAYIFLYLYIRITSVNIPEQSVMKNAMYSPQKTNCECSLR